MTNRIESLLSRIEDPQLRAMLATEVGAGPRRFGLVFEDHLPESVRLPGVRPRRGSKVAFREATGGDRDGLYEVVSPVRNGQAIIAPLNGCQDGGETKTPARENTVAVEELVTVAEFGDPVYPGLTHVDTVEGPGTDRSAPAHVVLEAENHHALQALQFSHESSVDLIYIDPPYNTGNKTWKYNDRYVAEQDGFRHSKWLSFMERRLVLARRLLKDTGVIIVAIGDDEHHRLRMLMDQIFGEQNFISSVAWQGGVKNDAKLSGGGADYMLIYARAMDVLRDAETRWREPKDGLEDLLAAGREAWERSGRNSTEATKLLSTWWGKNKRAYDPGLGDNVKVDTDGALFKVSDLSWPGPGGPRFDVLHPVTGKPVKVPTNGWRFTTPERMQDEIENGRVLFGLDHTSGIRRKTPLVDMAVTVPRPSFYRDRRASSIHLQKVLGDKRFPFPKDHEVLMRWIRMTAPKDAVVLDFFGGSGSTAEAVIRLNAEDGGTRQCILVTNNELAAKDDAALRKAGHQPGDEAYEALGVFRHVTLPRISTVVTGIRQDGSTYSAGLAGRVAFYSLQYLDAGRIRDDLAYAQIEPLLWLRSGALGRPPANTAPAGAFTLAPSHGVLHRLDAWRQFVAELPETARHAYVVTDSDTAFATVAATLPAGVEPVRLYERFLRTFEANTTTVPRAITLPTFASPLTDVERPRDAIHAA